MHFITFETDQPVMHIQRALDALARAGFCLAALHMTGGEGAADEPALVSLLYCGDANVGPNTLMMRLAEVPGITGVRGGVANEPARSPLRLVEAG